ncbi:hypothetical protein GQ44DRAFT_730366 [Phaeosphaeriaceae sp. PMI808]|nr:hypothetical protein GQ44DRAFT_730366 [Phaeosphaeriaceae sp. PMI808]
MPDRDSEYDTDDVSVTSTVESTNEGLYNIKRILAEGLGEDELGKPRRKYLIEWDGYEMHSCTWEPDDELKGTHIMLSWERDREEMGDDAFLQLMDDNQDAYDEACKKHKKHQVLKQQKRMKKRQKLRARPIIVEDSDDDIPILQRVRSNQQNTKSPVPATSLFVDTEDSNPPSPLSTLRQPESSLFVTQPPVTRRAPLQQSSSESGEESCSDDNSEDSLIGELVEKAKSKNRKRKEPSLGNSILSPKSKKNTMVPLMFPTPKQPGKTAHRQDQRPKLSRTLTAPTTTIVSKPTSAKKALRSLSDTDNQVSGAVSTRPNVRIGHSASAVTTIPTKTAKSISAGVMCKPTTLTAIRKSGTVSKTAIRMTNEPKTHQRKEWQSDKHFNTLMFRRKAELRSCREATPDLNTLEFVGGSPASLHKQRVPAPADNPYGRREAGVRRIREVEIDEPPQRTVVEESEFLRDMEIGKPPLVCPHWRLSNNCPYGPQKCNFRHQNQDEQGRDLPVGDMSGILPPKYRKPPVTCYFWLTSPAGCHKPETLCLFAHRNTGYIPQKGGKGGETFAIDPNILPVREQAIVPFLPPKEPKGKSKPKPSEFTCWYWNRGKCRLSSEHCIYQHKHTGIVAPEPGVINPTCLYWKNGHCQFTADQCKYKHYDTERQVNSDKNAAEPEHSMVWSPSEQAPSPPPAPLPPIESLPKATSCMQMKDLIEQALKIDFISLFEWGEDEMGQVMLDKRALLVYNPKYHSEELEVLTRWLLIHHVEVSSAWFEGCWDYFQRQIAKGGSGIVIAHPDFEDFSELPGFGQLLRKQVRILSLGMQDGIEYDTALSKSPPTIRHTWIDIFPLGGFIYITDDVFEKEPQLALRIIRLFIAKTDNLRKIAGQESDDTNLLWRLCVRPELMEYLIQRCEEQANGLEAGDPNVMARAELYTFLSDTTYIEQDSPMQPFSAIPDDFPIMSERRVIAEDQPIDYFDTLARNQEEANRRMVQYYATLQVDMRRDYRHFFVVHVEPTAVQHWKQEIQNIADIITPEQCIDELSRSGNKQMFDFCERYMSNSRFE